MCLVPAQFRSAAASVLILANLRSETAWLCHNSAWQSASSSSSGGLGLGNTVLC